MNSLKSIVKFSIYTIGGASLGFIISFIFLVDNSKEIEKETVKNSSSYNFAFEKASPAVVNIYSDQLISNISQSNQRRSNSLFNNRGSQIKTSLGSGVILSSDGYILTNQHVVGETGLRYFVALCSCHLVTSTFPKFQPRILRNLCAIKTLFQF